MTVGTRRTVQETSASHATADYNNRPPRRVTKLINTPIAARSQRLAEIREWLSHFAKAVRERDYDAGRRLFDEDVVSFGTVNQMLDGLQQLETRQWRIQREHGLGVALWSSQGHSNRGWFDRHGRATFIYQKRDGKWRSVHSHSSLVPLPAV